MNDEWVLVPRNPTNAMIRAACSALADSNRPSADYLSVREKHTHRWRMMVDAAPPPPFQVVITMADESPFTTEQVANIAISRVSPANPPAVENTGGGA